jgi:predicted transcriptional regulator
MASTMNTHSITVDLPQAIFDSVDRVARATHRSPEAVVKTMLAHALPPLDDVAPEEADALAALALLDDATLWQIARGQLPQESQEKLESLLELQSQNQLSAGQQSELQNLLDEYGKEMVRKAHANLLLARRGFQVTPQE